MSDGFSILELIGLGAMGIVVLVFLSIILASLFIDYDKFE